jgi:Protein of unknown function (DUF3299)
MSTAESAYAPPQAEEFKPYRAVSRSAVLSLIFALVAAPIAILTLVSVWFRYGDAVNMGFWTALFSVFAVALGWAGLRSIRRYPNEYTGKILGQIGLIAGIGQFVLGIVLSSFTYATEVPEGYTRVTFSELQPDLDRPELIVSPRAIELSGQPIFIKGYMHPGVEGMGNVNHFVLVFDYGTCCFGGQPKPTHMIEVRLPEGMKGLRYSRSTLKLAGKFQVGGGTGKFQELSNVLYHLDVDQIR